MSSVGKLQSEKEPKDGNKTFHLKSISDASGTSNVDDPSEEYKYSAYIKGLREYERFLRDGYFDIFHKEMEYQLQRNGLIYHIEFNKNSKALQNYERYKKFLINEHNKIIGIEVAEEGDIRKAMLKSCINMKWSSVEKILDRRQKIVMKRKKAVFEKELEYIAERSKLMLRYQFYIDNDGLNLFVKENKLADYLTGHTPHKEFIE